MDIRMDIRLAMDPTSGFAQDGQPRFFSAKLGEKPASLHLRDRQQGKDIRAAIISGSLAKTEAVYKGKVYDLLVGGLRVGEVIVEEQE